MVSVRSLPLTCPGCRHGLPPLEEWSLDGVRCPACATTFPLVRGIPRFVNSDSYAASFSFEWGRHRYTQLDTVGRNESERTFRDKTGLGPHDVRGKLVLDVGCGMGRFADVVARWGGDIVGVDLSCAVEAAHENLTRGGNVLVLQGDLFNLPFAEETFDIVYSIGVLHHTSDCEKAFRQLPRLLKPGGQIAIWVYGPMGLWAKTAALYRRVTVRMPPRLLYTLCYVAIPLYFLHRLRPLGRLSQTMLPTSMHPQAAWRVLDTFDWYSPRYQSRHTYPEVYRWFVSEGLTDIRLLDFPVAVIGRKPDKETSK